jgi:hypothetical protein
MISFQRLIGTDRVRWLRFGAGGAAVVVASAILTFICLNGQAAIPATGSVAAVGHSGSPPTPPPVATAGFPTGRNEPGIFTDRCAYSHSVADDPILAPNQPGAAMHHDFYGNTATSATSTAAGLVGGSTSCTTTADASAYWTPVLYQHGIALTPGAALIYWRRPARDVETVQTVPAGLQLIAGNEAATAPQPLTVVAWTCSGDITMTKASTTPHDCASPSRLRVVVMFPSCWDGHTLTGVGQTNVVYRDRTGCPASHPVQIPQIVFHVTYPTSSAVGLTLSMTPTMTGSTDTEHVDFVNGWTQSIVNADVAACVATSTRCGPVTGSDAKPGGPAIGTR